MEGASGLVETKALDRQVRQQLLLVLALLVLPLWILTAKSSVDQIGKPFAGFAMLAGAYVSPYQHESWPGFKAGLRGDDILLAADGVPVLSVSDLYRELRNTPEGTAIRYEVLRKGAHREFLVPLTTMAWADVANDFLVLTAIAASLLIVGTATCWLAPSIPGARGLFFLGLASWGFFLTYFDANTAHRLAVLNLSTVAMIGACFGYLAFVFPGPLAIARKAQWVPLAPFGVALALSILGAIAIQTPAYSGTTPYAFQQALAFKRISTIWLIGAMLVFVALQPFRFWWASRRSIERQRAAISLIGAAVAFGPTVALWGVPFLAGMQPLLPLNQALLFISAFPLAMAYAIVRHRLFDIDVVIRRSVLYTLLTLVLAAVYVGVSTALQQGILLGSGLRGTEAGLAATALVVALFVPLRDWLRDKIDRLFFRQAYDARRVVEEVSTSLTAMIDLDRITIRLLEGAQQALHASCGSIYLQDVASGAFRPAAWGDGPMPAEIPGDHPALADLERGEVLTRVMLPVKKRHRVSDQLEAIEADLLVPIVSQGGIIGFFSLGPKKSEKPYNDSDLGLLVTLAGQGAIAISNALKVDELRRTRDSLAQADKMAAIGRLAAGVAHELNSPIMVVGGQLEVLGKAIPAEESDRIGRQFAKMRRLINDLLRFSRQTPPQMEDVDAGLLIDQVLALLRLGDERFKGILIRNDVQPDLPPLRGDPSHLEQVFVNLLTNAAHAVEGREVPEIQVSAAVRGQKVVFAITDNGTGIRKEDLGKVFDPFFTTKGTGRGTGLGLAMSFGIVQDHGGYITVESREGEGTTMLVGLPLAAREAVALETIEDAAQRQSAAGR